MSAQSCDNRPANRAPTDDGVEMEDMNPNHAQPETSGAEPSSAVDDPRAEMMRNLFDLSPGDLPGLDTFFAYIEHKFASPALQGGPFGVSDIWAWPPPDNAPLPLNDFRLAVEHGGKKWGLLTRFTEPVLVQFSMIHDYYTRATPGYQLFEEDEPAELYKPRLGYDCLAKLGGVTLRFVDCIIDHLKFDRPSRTLSIYRFPSLYLAHLRRTRKKSALAYMLRTASAFREASKPRLPQTTPLCLKRFCDLIGFCSRSRLKRAIS